MLLGLLTALLICATNYPLSKYLAARTQTPKDFRIRYYSFGLLGPVVGFVLLTVLLPFHPVIYTVLAISTYAIIGRDVEKKHLKPAAVATAPEATETPDSPQQPA